MSLCVESSVGYCTASRWPFSRFLPDKKSLVAQDFLTLPVHHWRTGLGDHMSLSILSCPGLFVVPDLDMYFSFSLSLISSSLVLFFLEGTVPLLIQWSFIGSMSAAKIITDPSLSSLISVKYLKKLCIIISINTWKNLRFSIHFSLVLGKIVLLCMHLFRSLNLSASPLIITNLFVVNSLIRKNPLIRLISRSY